MTKFTVLVGVVFCAVFAGGVAGYNGRYRDWERFHGQQVGFGGGKCSALSGMLPDPQSGCCGKHAGETDTGDEGNNGGGSNDGNDIGGGDQGDEGNNGGGNDDYDIGGGDQDDGNNDIGGGGGNGNGNGFDFGNGIDLGDIFGGLGLGNGGNPWFDGFNTKKVAENASDTIPDKFITAGTPAGIREFPWLVRLLIKVQEGYQTGFIGCGGSLISPRFVLTAAHCVKVNYRSNNDISIVLAEYDTRKSPRDCVGRTCVDNVVMHPDRVIAHQGFEPNQLSNDVALLRLRGSAPYSEFIRPICLPPFNIDSPDKQGTPLSISGWGQIGTNRPASPIKLKAQVKLVPHQACSRHYPGLTRGHVCAASRNGQDTCQGDSGGPLMVRQGDNYYVVGIVSGKSAQTTCGTSFPTLYTNVFAYSKWIKQHMGN